MLLGLRLTADGDDNVRQQDSFSDRCATTGRKARSQIGRVRSFQVVRLPAESSARSTPSSPGPARTRPPNGTGTNYSRSAAVRAPLRQYTRPHQHPSDPPQHQLPGWRTRARRRPDFQVSVWLLSVRTVERQKQTSRRIAERSVDDTSSFWSSSHGLSGRQTSYVACYRPNDRWAILRRRNETLHWHNISITDDYLIPSQHSIPYLFS